MKSLDPLLPASTKILKGPFFPKIQKDSYTIGYIGREKKWVEKNSLKLKSQQLKLK